MSPDEIELRIRNLETLAHNHRHTGLDNTKTLGGASGTTYGGTVTGAGAAGSTFPTGWSVAHNGTGDYTVTHNLGTTAYVVVVSNFAGSAAYMILQSFDANSFRLLTYNVTPSVNDTPFSFILQRNS